MQIVRTVGSGLNNKIVINKPGISDVHAEITYVSGGMMIVEDLGTPAGTYVNNRKIQGKKVLKSGDILCFGEHVFPFEEHYPEMLKTQAYENVLDDSLEGEPEELRLQNDKIEEEALQGLTGIKHLINRLQFPKDRQLTQRIWFLVMASVILLSVVLPWLSWSNPSGATLLIDDDFAPMSGISTIYSLFDVKVSGAPVLYVLIYGFTFLIFLGTITVMICYFLIGLKAWTPRSLLGVRRLSQVVILLFGINFFFQFLRYVWYWLDGENAVVVSRGLLGSHVDESRVFVEYFGIGYWLCGFAIILALRSTRNGLWRPSFFRKWTTLSCTFWLPMVVLITLVHQSSGVFQREIDVDEYEKKFGMKANQFYNGRDMKERFVINAPAMANLAYLQLIREWKRDEDRSGRWQRGELSDRRKKENRYLLGVWLALHGVLFLSIFQLFRKQVRGMTTLILSLVLLAFTTGLTLFMYLLIDLMPSGNAFEDVTIGYGCFLAMIAALGMVGEQFYFWNSKTEKAVKVETAETLDDLV